MKITVCDLCKKNSPDAKIKYKYKAKKRFWWLRYGQEVYKECGWERAELCQKCLDKIIKAESEEV